MKWNLDNYQDDAMVFGRLDDDGMRDHREEHWRRRHIVTLEKAQEAANAAAIAFNRWAYLSSHTLKPWHITLQLGYKLHIVAR